VKQWASTALGKAALDHGIGKNGELCFIRTSCYWDVW